MRPVTMLCFGGGCVSLYGVTKPGITGEQRQANGMLRSIVLHDRLADGSVQSRCRLPWLWDFVGRQRQCNGPDEWGDIGDIPRPL